MTEKCPVHGVHPMWCHCPQWPAGMLEAARAKLDAMEVPADGRQRYCALCDETHVIEPCCGVYTDCSRCCVPRHKHQPALAAADAVLTLINTSPRTPTREAVAGVIAESMKGEK